MLRGSEKGTFLLRFSSKNGYVACVSQGDGTVSSALINKTPKGLQITKCGDETFYPTLRGWWLFGLEFP